MEQRTILQLVAATNNEHKLSEIRPLIEPDFRILSLVDIGCYTELPETSDTLEGNSIQKARFILDNFQLPCFADDTGLEVYALDGAPGVYSARYAGPKRNSDDNIDLLLKNLSAKADRKARFRTIISLLGLGAEQLFEGIVTGTILHERKGNKGFGYDPVFQPDGFSKTLAEMSIAEKNAISHRGQAIKKLIDYLKKYRTASK